MHSRLMFVFLLAGCPKPAQPPVYSTPTPLPEMTFADLSGESRTLGEYDGKVVLLDFWATWCAPCRESLPIYDQWQQELGEDFVVVAVSVDERLGPVPNFAKQNMPNVQVWHDTEHAGAEALDLPAMPTAFLVDRSGNIVSQHIGFVRKDADPLHEEITTLLAAPAP